MIDRHDNPFTNQPVESAEDFVTNPLNPILQSDAELLGGPTEPLTTTVPVTTPDRRFTAPGNDIIPTQAVRRHPNGQIDLGSVADRLQQEGYDDITVHAGQTAVGQVVNRPHTAAERIAAIDARIDNHTPESPRIGKSEAVATIGRLNPDNLLGQ